jgi:hypothetical protein
MSIENSFVGSSCVNWFKERNSKFTNIIDNLTKEYNVEDFKKFEATLVARSKDECLIDLDKAINFDIVFQEIDKYFNDKDFKMKGFVGELLALSKTFKEKFIKRYPRYIIDEKIQLVNPYYDERKFTNDLSELFEFKNELFDKTIENDFNVYKYYQKILETIIQFKLMIEIIHMKKEIKEFEAANENVKFISLLTSPYFIHQSKIFEHDVNEEELKLYQYLEAEYEQLKLYIEKNYKTDSKLETLANVVRMKVEKLNEIKK